VRNAVLLIAGDKSGPRPAQDGSALPAVNQMLFSPVLPKLAT
jgi:hypothetical protein